MTFWGTPPAKRPAAERFWEKVEKTPSCWEWTANKKDGYGYFRLTSHAQVMAHRFSWTLENGPIPAGLLVCHHCDNRKCVRPDHLFLGTDADNNRDMMRKGRHRAVSGELVKSSKLRASDVLAIRALRAGGMSGPKIAKMYGVSNPVVYGIVKKRGWKHVQGCAV